MYIRGSFRKLAENHNFQGISRTGIFTNHYNFKGFDNFTHSASLTIIHQSPGWALDDIFRWPFQQDWCFLESQVACLPLLGISSKLSLPALNLCYHLWTGVFARLIHRKRYFIWAQHRQQMSPFSSERLYSDVFPNTWPQVSFQSTDLRVHTGFN